MGQLLFVANPAARAFTGGLYRRIKTLLGQHHEVEHAWPNSPGEVEQIVADAATRGADFVVVMGGDGVIHHAAQALVSGTTALGIVPAGTANVLAKVLGIPTRPLAAARLIADGSTIRRLPVARVMLDSDRSSFTRYATFNIGFGYDADVVRNAESGPDRKARLGTIHYTGNALQTVWAYRKRPPMMRVRLQHAELPAVMTAIQIHDTYTFMGRVPMVVGPDDPLSGIVVTELGITSATTLALRSFRSRISSSDEIEQFAGVTALEVTSDHGVPVQADGELLAPCRRAQVSLLAESLPVVVPPPST